MPLIIMPLLDKYITLAKEIIGQEIQDECILEEMDRIYYSMSPKEREFSQILIKYYTENSSK